MRAARIAETEGVMPPPADMAETQLINVIHKTSFLDLSAELRNGIYMLLLTQPWPMTIGSIDDWKGSSRALNKPAIQCRNLQDHCLREHEIPHHNTAMLQVNRQIHSEATSVLYGHNRIQWLTRDISKTFLNRIGPSIIHLRDVKLPHNTTKSTMRTVLNALKPAGRLVRLEISVHTWHNMDAHRMAKELGPFIRAQDKLRKAGDSLSAVEILYFEHFGTTAAKISPYETEVKALLQAEVEG